MWDPCNSLGFLPLITMRSKFSLIATIIREFQYLFQVQLCCVLCYCYWFFPFLLCYRVLCSYSFSTRDFLQYLWKRTWLYLIILIMFYIYYVVEEAKFSQNLFWFTNTFCPAKGEKLSDIDENHWSFAGTACL